MEENANKLRELTLDIGTTTQNLTTLALVIPEIFKAVQNLKDGHVA